MIYEIWRKFTDAGDQVWLNLEIVMLAYSMSMVFFRNDNLDANVSYHGESQDSIYS